LQHLNLLSILGKQIQKIMPTPQEQYDQAKTRLESNIQKLQLLNNEIKQKEEENAEAIKIVQEIQQLKQEANLLMQPIFEDQGAVRILSETDGVITEKTVESK
jgi:cell shape-determining protein MreC